MTDLRTAAQQALEALHNIEWHGSPGAWTLDDCKVEDAIHALRAALAQEQPNPPGCDRCNHPLYAATRCRVCGRVTEQADPKEGGNLPPPLQEPAVAEPVQEPVAMRYGYDGYGYQYIDSGSGSDWRTRIKDAEPLYAQPMRAEPVEPVGRVVSANCEYATVRWLKQTSDVGGGDPQNSRSWPIAGDAVYTDPPKRKPLMQEQLYALYDEHATHQEEGPAMSGWFDFARAIERAHGIGGQDGR